MKKRFLLFPLCAAFALGAFAGCGGGEQNTPGGNDPSGEKDPPKEEYKQVDYTAEHSASNRFVNFVSTDKALDSFLNEYAERHMRDKQTTTAVGTQGVGRDTRSTWREWDSMIGGWWDASSENGAMSHNFATNDAVNAWLTLDQEADFPNVRSLIDNQGYIWNENVNTLAGWGMGWDFPSYKNGGKAWDFPGSDKEQAEWAVSPASLEVTQRASKLQLKATEKVDEISITTTEFGVEAKYTPFLRVGFSFESTEANVQLDDLYIEWQTSDSPTWSQDKCVKFSEFSTRGFELTSGKVEQKDYTFPMYLNKNWYSNFESNRTITALRLTLKGKQPFRGTLAYNFIASEYDDRQPLNNCNYILAAKNNLEFSRDKELLKVVLPNARKAMNFLLNQLDGNSGLISTAYLVGHFSDGMHAAGTGIGNGYWDVDAFPTVNLYCNVSYYNALVAMKYLEDMAENLGVAFEEATTKNANMDGYDVYTAQTKASLSDLIATCKNRIQTEFWNEATGRFHVGFYDDGSGYEQDHGYTMFNEQVIASGLATEAQTKSILQWINGERTVKGDNSTGEDIYYYEIAPRFNTQDILNDFVWLYSCDWNGNVQNGGTALHLTYYDIVAQSFGSTQKAYSRLKALQSWFEKVKSAGGEGKNFYREYYNNHTDIVLQGGKIPGTNKDQNGLVGVDYEFLEAALLFRSVPDAFFGMSTSANGTLNFAPALPDGLDWWRMENLVYAGNYYDVAIGKYFFETSAVAEYSQGSAQEAYISVSLKEPSFKYAVYLNGNRTTAYSKKDGMLRVLVPFGNVKIEIKEA